jgi:hypothetical protein
MSDLAGASEHRWEVCIKQITIQTEPHAWLTTAGPNASLSDPSESNTATGVKIEEQQE